MSPQMKVTPADVARTVLEQTSAGQVDVQEVQDGIDQLAGRATIESFDVSEEAVSIEQNGHFTANGTVYVSLEYPGRLTLAEELPIEVDGQIDPASGRIVIEHIRADLSPFRDEDG